MGRSMSTNMDDLTGATDEGLVAELSARIRRYKDQSQEETGEHLIEDLLDRTGIEKFVNYWKLGDFIYEENPYFLEDEIHLSLSPDKVRRAGLMRDNNAGRPFKQTNPGQPIPKPPARGGPAGPPRAYYHRLGRGSGELGAGSPLGGESEEDNVRLERNIIKEVEIEYAPPIEDDRKWKSPHIVILYGGGDH